MYLRAPRDILGPTQPTFTCSKSRIEKGVKYVPS